MTMRIAATTFSREAVVSRTQRHLYTLLICSADIVNMEFEDSNSGSSRIADYGLFSIDVPLDNDVCQAGLSGELLVDGDWIRFDMDVASAGPCGGSKIFDTNPDGYRAVLSVNTPSGWLDIARSSEFFTCVPAAMTAVSAV